MKKLAILISGEYRKFDITRKTMPFLDDPGVDVYISTWDKTIYSSKKINLHVEEIITEDKIKRDLGREAIINIEDHNNNPGDRYNSKMIDRWLRGFKLIKDSEIKYDYVMVMRTDLFFHPAHIVNFDNMEKYDSAIGFSWADSLHLGKLPDLIFVSSFKNIEVLFNSLILEKWNTDKEHDWHIWWYSFIRSLSLDIINLPEMSYISFCRYWVNQFHDFTDAINIHHDWRDLRLLHECDKFGDNFAKGVWPDHVLSEAREKWNSGYFSKYMGAKAAIFDLDGVLVSTDILHKNALSKAILKTINRVVDISEKCMLSTKEKLKKLQENYNFSDTEFNDIINLKDEIFFKMVSNLSVENNIVETLTQLKKLNIKTAIASNSRKVNIDMVLKATNLEKYFDVIVSAEEVVNRKPAPDILFEAYKRLGVRGTDTIFIEDSDEGVQAGLQSLSKVIRINNPSELSIDLFKDWLE